MIDLPWATHRNLIEPLTERPHVSSILVKRYLSFITKIEISSKEPLKTLLNIAKRDVRTITGANLSRIMITSGRCSIDDLKDVKVHYHHKHGKSGS